MKQGPECRPSRAAQSMLCSVVLGCDTRMLRRWHRGLIGGTGAHQAVARREFTPPSPGAMCNKHSMRMQTRVEQTTPADSPRPVSGPRSGREAHPPSVSSSPAAH